MSLPENFSCLRLAKLGKPTALISFIQLVKFIFIEHLQIGWDIDLFHKKNYETVTKEQCPGILSCSFSSKEIYLNVNISW